ncbi:MAG: ExeA family protein, partial [Polaromonas sp.]
MYAPFFGLTQAPFSIAPDPRMLFMSERHREALAHLLYGLGGGGGFVLLTGEIGTGKTTVCRCFLEQIPAHCNVAYIFNPKLTAVELLQSICDEFHVSVPQKDRLPPTVKDYLDPLNAFLLQAHAAGRNNVLIIDEAQNLSAEVLEQLRLLTNLETSERKLLQIVLIGQPELRTMLQRPELEQLAQRVIARYHLDALTPAETAQYIQHRLEVSGLKHALPFDRKGLKRIQQIARGVPRRINLLCDRALLGAFAGGQATVSSAIVDKAANEVFDPPVRAVSSAWRWRRSLALVGLSVAAGAGLVAMTRLVTPAPRVPEIAALAAPTVAAAPAAVASAAAVAADATITQPAPPPTLLRDENQAWRELAQAWKLSPGEGDPCQAL